MLGEGFHSDKFGLLLDGLRQHEQKKVLEATIHKLESQYLSPYYGQLDLSGDTGIKAAIGGVSAAVAAVTKDRLPLREQLNEWLASGAGGNIVSVSMRRALLATYENDIGTLYSCQLTQKLSRRERES